ncbi:hypothetical protein ADP71_26570 [Vitreoscilla sp. C1]|uniref:hypothetical protein n=1 Tax=Vitreoscilla sp. (strain C1) TaxID=96942 RepID=UPI00148E9EBC|nr:hypothetical protein [Vitreoscilla sp. C1]AUZ05942.2 hypothetical protein ADP71_26570 [Vitreoscilla sp. C1]
MTDLNLGNALFEGFNDKEGLMICGYDYGEEDSKNGGEEIVPDMSKDCTFSNKSLRYGEIAHTWVRYDKKIRTWFSIWGHPLNENGLGDDFDKCIIQTNWALGSSPKSKKISYYLKDENIANFIEHVTILQPKVILFMGNQLLTKVLRSQKVWDQFTPIMGDQIEPLRAIRMEGYEGKPLAYINKFTQCTVVGLPHPSGSHGLTSEYIDFCKAELEPIITQFKKEKNIL